MDFKRSMVFASVIMLMLMLVNGFLAHSIPRSLKWYGNSGWSGVPVNWCTRERE